MQEIGTDHVTEVVIIVSLTIGTMLGSFFASLLNKDINSVAWRGIRLLKRSAKRRRFGR